MNIEYIDRTHIRTHTTRTTGSTDIGPRNPDKIIQPGSVVGCFFLLITRGCLLRRAPAPKEYYFGTEHGEGP